MEQLKKDYSMQFEKVVNKYLLNTTADIRLASYYDNNIVAKSVIISVCLKEILLNQETQAYTTEEIDKLFNFIKELEDIQSSHRPTEVIDFFIGRM